LRKAGEEATVFFCLSLRTSMMIFMWDHVITKFKLYFRKATLGEIAS